MVPNRMNRMLYMKQQVLRNVDIIEKEGVEKLNGDDALYYDSELNGAFNWAKGLKERTDEDIQYKHRQMMIIKFRLDEIIDNMRGDYDY